MQKNDIIYNKDQKEYSFIKYTVLESNLHEIQGEIEIHL